MIIASGGIQVQLMSVIKPENEEQAKFNWEFYLEDEITMVFQIKFD